jgi:hypothetical protein
MAILRGDLSVLGFANLLQVLVQSGCEGLLTLDFGAYRKVLKLGGPGVRLLRGSKRSSVLDRLIHRANSASLDSPAVAPEACADRPALEHVIREWLLEEVCEVFRWSRGTFTFEPGEGSEKGKDAAEGLWSRYAVHVDVMTIVLEAARRGDELARIRTVLPELGDIPERTAGSADPSAQESGGEVFADVLPLIDGRRSLGQILRTSVFPRFSVLQAIHELFVRRLIRFRTAGWPADEMGQEPEASGTEVGDVLRTG